MEKEYRKLYYRLFLNPPGKFHGLMRVKPGRLPFPFVRIKKRIREDPAGFPLQQILIVCVDESLKER